MYLVEGPLKNLAISIECTYTLYRDPLREYINSLKILLNYQKTTPCLENPGKIAQT